MKKSIIVLVILVLGISGCRYEEGNALTNLDKRIAGIWSVSSVYKNDEKTDTESPTLVESKGAVYEFYKTKILLIRYIHNNVVCQSYGSWEFDEKKKNIELMFLNQYYHISRRYEIVKFKNKELKVRFTDDNGVKWALVLVLEQSLPYGM